MRVRLVLYFVAGKRVPGLGTFFLSQLTTSLDILRYLSSKHLSHVTTWPDMPKIPSYNMDRV